MVALTFPDGARRDYPQGTTGLDIAAFRRVRGHEVVIKSGIEILGEKPGCRRHSCCCIWSSLPRTA